MRRLIVLALVTALWHPADALAQPKPPAGDREARPQDPKRSAGKVNLRRLLRAKVDQVEWDDTPLSDVIDWVRERGEMNVVVRWNVLEPAGVTPDSPVSLRLKDASLASVLSEALAGLSSTEEIRYLGVGNTLTISTREDLNRKMYVKAYPVNDLLFRIPEFTDAPAVNIQQTGGGGGGAGGGSASQNPFQGGAGGGGGGGGGDEDTRTKKDRIADLIELIVSTVEPEAWRENGGQATIQAFGDSTIVVRASLEVHEKLGGPLLIEE
jgi:uncharacterized membrane protein YgcG